ncbi:MAG: ABC transporter substrate-binding protein [Deltaproteobacteria bacterium]|jgi:iron complex transport system substrate-binding protein|nr:ABC transporter substrate-binding protein [Deltaproteobacteria bacterium]
MFIISCWGQKTLRLGLILVSSLFFLLALGLAHPLKADGPRVISLYAAHTENLLRLGARDLLVGISAQETYQGPETAGWVKPAEFSARDDVEKYLAARADIILARPQHLASSPHLWAALEKAGVKIWARQVLLASDLDSYWLELGELVGRKNEAQKLIAAFKNDLSLRAAKTGVRRPGVFLEAIHQQIKTFTPGSIPVWLLELAGGRNVAADVEMAQGRIVADFGPERLLALADEVEIYISQEGPMNRVSLEAIKSRSLFRNILAIKNNRVYKIPENLIARPTPGILEGLAALTKIMEEANTKKP